MAMTPKLGEVWKFRAIGIEVLFLLIARNVHGSFDLLDLETGKVSEFWKDPKTGTGVGEWVRFA